MTDHVESYFPCENQAQLKNYSRHGCVEIIPDGRDKGKWTNAPCEKRNIIVCRKKQGYTM